ncbi:MAG: hypothetical protein L6R36_005941 [Xanthoria steineri]|nr:MAG: hypothetical protein L6R36_005941 [Xanthoria steineri]
MASPSPSHLAAPSSPTPSEDLPPLSPTSDTSSTISTDTTDTETFGDIEDDLDLMTFHTRALLANILATTQAHSRIARSLTTPHRPQSQPAISKPRPTEPASLEPLWRNGTLGQLIGRLIATKNMTRAVVWDEDDAREREVAQVKALRGVIRELGEWDRDVLAVRERVLGIRGEGEGEGAVRIFVTPPEGEA